MFLLIAGTWLRVVEDRTLTHIAAAAALIAFLLSIFLARRKRRQAPQGQHAPSATPRYPVHVWPTMTPGYGYAPDQPYRTAVPMQTTSHAYANQPPPGPPPPEEDPFKPELFSGLPAEAPPSYVEAQAAAAPVQAPEPAYPNGHRSTAHFAADGPTGSSTSAAPAATTTAMPTTPAPAATTTTPTVPETAAPAQTAPTEPATASKASAAESTTPTATQSSSA